MSHGWSSRQIDKNNKRNKIVSMIIVFSDLSFIFAKMAPKLYDGLHFAHIQIFISILSPFRNSQLNLFIDIWFLICNKWPFFVLRLTFYFDKF
jgi:hypothetical protein